MSDRTDDAESGAEQPKTKTFSLRDALVKKKEEEGKAPPHLVVIRALMDEILPAIEEGWTLADIYRLLKDQGKVSCSDQTFRRLFNAEKERHDRESGQSRPAPSSPAAVLGRGDTQTPTRLTPPRPPNKL